MQLAEIENERRRHLANWLIDSSPHMPKNAQHRDTQHKVNDKLFNTSIFNDSFLLSRKTSAGSSDQHGEKLLAPQHTSFPFSKSNTPSRSSQPVNCNSYEPSLRRFMTQDTSANTFSVTEFEMARQTRKNEKEQVKFTERTKSKLLITGCDSSTGGSRRSDSEAESEPLTANMFFERFRLPIIARISEPLQERQSLENKIRKQSSLKNFFQKFPVKSSQQSEVNNNSELFLLHRLCKHYKVFHATGTGKHVKKKSFKIPEDFGGTFTIFNLAYLWKEKQKL